VAVRRAYSDVGDIDGENIKMNRAAAAAAAAHPCMLKVKATPRSPTAVAAAIPKVQVQAKPPLWKPKKAPTKAKASTSSKGAKKRLNNARKINATVPAFAKRNTIPKNMVPRKVVPGKVESRKVAPRKVAPRSMAAAATIAMTATTATTVTTAMMTATEVKNIIRARKVVEKAKSTIPATQQSQ